MERISRIVVNVIFCIQVLLIFLLFVEDKVLLPAWLQVAGRMHPLVLHLPIGILIFLVVIVFFQKQLDSSFTNEIIHIGLVITSLSASIAALFGFFLSLQSDYGTAVLMRHKASGIILSFLCYAVLLWHRGGMKRSVFLALGSVSFLMLVVAGHTGAVLTHGENFLFAPISKSTV
ncbi:MAG TPA: peptidylprolyl isomerase, partial [Chryseolinea sp.]